MSSVCYGGSIRLNHNVEDENRDPMFEGGYPYSIPKVYLDGVGESYFPQWCFNWDNDSVVVVRDKHVVKYTKSVYIELLAKNKEGEIVWMDGRCAPLVVVGRESILTKNAAPVSIRLKNTIWKP